jgi:hypothetical protein
VIYQGLSSLLRCLLHLHAVVMLAVQEAAAAACIRRGDGSGENQMPFTIGCEDAGPGLVISVIKANYGENCNDICKCVEGNMCMPCCSGGGPCCPSCVSSDHGNDFVHLAKVCNGHSTCSASYGGDPNDPAGGCGKLYAYEYACCPPDEPHCCAAGPPPAVQATFTAVWIAVGVLSAYLAGATLKRRVIDGHSGYALIPHRELWIGVGGLVRDGCAFVAGGVRSRGSSTVEPMLTSAAQSLAVAEAHTSDGDAKPINAHAHPAKRASRSNPSALHAAAAVGDEQTLRTLLQDAPRSPAINQGDHHRYTALHVACAGGHVTCAELLLSAGCDSTLHNENGLTAAELAKSLRQMQILGMFQTRKSGKTTTKDSVKRKEKSAGIVDGLAAGRALKAQLTALGLSAKGSKAELRARLAAAKNTAT